MTSHAPSTPAAGRSGPRAIVAATDLNVGSDDALRVAAEIARTGAADLHVLHAMDLVGRSLRELFRPLHEGVLFHARDGLEAQVRECVEPRVAPGSVRLDARDLPTALTALAHEVDADLVVLSSLPTPAPTPDERGRGARTSPLKRIPVLVVRPGAVWPPKRIGRCESVEAAERARRTLGLALSIGSVDCEEGPDRLEIFDHPKRAVPPSSRQDDRRAGDAGGGTALYLPKAGSGRRPPPPDAADPALSTDAVAAD